MNESGVPRTVTVAMRRGLAVSRKTAFEFLDMPSNMLRVAPCEAPLSLTKFPKDLRPGVVFGYRFERWPVKFDWEAVVSEYQPKTHVKLIQSRGYYPRWEFGVDLSETDTGCEVSLRLDYEYPAGLFASLADRYFVAQAMERFVQSQLQGLEKALDQPANA